MAHAPHGLFGYLGVGVLGPSNDQVSHREQNRIPEYPPIRVLKNKHQAVSQGVRRFGKRSIVGHM
jgi:hypothetical protein